jgi:hypothetical protein
MEAPAGNLCALARLEPRTKVRRGAPVQFSNATEGGWIAPTRAWRRRADRARHRRGRRCWDIPDAREHGAHTGVAPVASHRVARDGRDGTERGAVLRRAGSSAAASGRWIRVLARSVRPRRRLLVWLEVSVGDGSGDHRRVGGWTCRLRRRSARSSLLSRRLEVVRS